MSPRAALGTAAVVLHKVSCPRRAHAGEPDPTSPRLPRETERLAEAEAVASVGSRGDSSDNAMAEASDFAV